MSAQQEKPENQWKKLGSCLYRYVPSGVYYALIKFRGKQIRRTLETKDLALARRKVQDLRRDLELTILSWPPHPRGIRKGSRYHVENSTWTSGPALRKLENLFVEKHAEYGFGPQHRFEPLRNDFTVRAAVSYLVRYLQKGIDDAIGRTVYTETTALEGPREVKVSKFRKVVPRSYRFGRNALRAGLCTTLLTWGQRKRRAIGVFCVDHQIDMEGIPDLAAQKYHWMHPSLATRTFWRLTGEKTDTNCGYFRAVFRQDLFSRLLLYLIADDQI